MNRTDAIALIESALNEPPGCVSDATALESLAGWDSVGWISVIAAMDDRYHVVLPPEKLTACRTAGELVDLVAGRLSKAA